MDQNYGILDLYSRYSLIRKLFLENAELSLVGVPEVDIPSRFNIKSFIPKKGLDLCSLSDEIKNELVKIGVDKNCIKKTVPGVCEALKNAYEHGHKKDNSKEIFFADCFSDEKIEFLIGDKGDKLNPNFVPYGLIFKQKSHDEFYSKIPTFYNYVGELYSPVGHSGVGLKVMNMCFEEVDFFKSKFGGLLTYLSKPFKK